MHSPSHRYNASMHALGVTIRPAAYAHRLEGTVAAGQRTRVSLSCSRFLTDCDEPASCAGHPPGKVDWSCLLMVQPAPPHNQCRARAAPKFSSHNARPVRNRNAIITTERGLLACNHSAGARCGNQRRTTRDDTHGPNGLLGGPGRAPPKMTRITLNTAIIQETLAEGPADSAVLDTQ